MSREPTKPEAPVTSTDAAMLFLPFRVVGRMPRIGMRYLTVRKLPGATSSNQNLTEARRAFTARAGCPDGPQTLPDRGVCHPPTHLGDRARQESNPTGKQLVRGACSGPASRCFCLTDGRVTNPAL